MSLARDVLIILTYAFIGALTLLACTSFVYAVACL